MHPNTVWGRRPLRRCDRHHTFGAIFDSKTHAAKQRMWIPEHTSVQLMTRVEACALRYKSATATGERRVGTVARQEAIGFWCIWDSG